MQIFSVKTKGFDGNLILLLFIFMPEQRFFTFQKRIGQFTKRKFSESIEKKRALSLGKKQKLQ